MKIAEDGFKLKQFTLIELLIVIAIIAVLAGMLMPALSQAKGKAKTVVCMGNLKGMVIPISNYMSDYPDCFFHSGGSGRIDVFGNTTYESFYSYTWAAKLHLLGYLPRNTPLDAVSCPVIPRPGSIDNGVYYFYTYGAYHGGNVTNFKDRNFTATKKMSQIFLIGDMQRKVGGYAWACYGYDAGVALIHNKAANFLAADMHVDSLTYENAQSKDYYYPSPDYKCSRALTEFVMNGQNFHF